MQNLTAEKLFNYLSDLKKEGCDLSKITINYRHDINDDVECLKYVGEDLFDEETNEILESIILMADTTDY